MSKTVQDRAIVTAEHK